MMNDSIIEVTPDTVDLIESLHIGEGFSFNCLNCDKHVVMTVRCKSRFPRYKTLLCRTCSLNKNSDYKDRFRKVHRTCLEKYGVEYASQSSEVREKVKATCLKRYGVENPSYSEDVLAKRKQTCLKHFGVEVSSQAPEVQEKFKKTCMEHYGVDHPSKAVEVKEKKKQTCLEHYGTEYNLQAPEVRDSIRNTNIEKYGLRYTPSRRVYWNGLAFDSNWEVIFYRYWSAVPEAVIEREPCCFQYTFEGKAHDYIPDFWLRKPDGTEGYYEVKGDQFFAVKEGKEVMVNPYDHSLDGLAEAKYQCALEHGVIFVRREEIKRYELYSSGKGDS